MNEQTRELEDDDMPEKNQLDYICGLSDEEITRRFREAIRIDEEIRTI